MGYTDERPASRYPAGSDAFSEEYEAARRYPDDRRGPRSAPGSNRAPSRYNSVDESGGYDRGQRDMGGYGHQEDAQGYDDAGWNYPQLGSGARGARDNFAESSVWQSGGAAAGEWPRKVTVAPTKKASSGWFPTVFRLAIVIIVIVGLVVTVGPDLAPQLGKYLPFLGSASSATPPPTFATYTPGPTPTNLASYKLFSSANGGFAIEYPSSWGTTTTTAAHNDTVNQFTQPNSPNVVIVERPAILDSATDAQVIQAEVNGATKNGLSLTEITGLATTEGAGGEVWQRHEYTVTNKSGAKLHLALLVCHHLGKAYAVVLIGSDTGFSTNDTATFEPMLRTFRFL
jgi:hypothetical protein